MKQMRKNRRADTNDVPAEYFIFGSDDLHHRLLTVYTDMIQSSRLEETWRKTMFTMLPKSGDCQKPNKWRPIEILNFVYKIFAKLLYKRSKRVMDCEQSKIT